MQIVPAEGPILDRVLASTFDLWHDGLNAQTHGRFYAAQRATAWGSAHLSRWALVNDGAVLASAKAYRFDATLDRRSVRVAGLGAVFTEAAHRRHGHARVLIERLIEKAAADGVDLALLFSEIGADYYGRLGFTAIPSLDLTLRVREDARRGAPMTLVRAGEERDIADLVAMGEARAMPYRFHLNRDRDLIHHELLRKRLLAGLSPAGARDLQFFVAEEGTRAVAYVVISTRGSEWTIEDAGDRDPAGARLGAILQALIARDPAERRPSILAWLPDDFRPPQIEVIGETPSKDVMMIRPLTGDGTPAAPLQRRDVLYWRADLF